VNAIRKECEELEFKNIRLEADVFSQSLSNRWLQGESRPASYKPRSPGSCDSNDLELLDIEDTDRTNAASPAGHNTEHYSKIIDGLLK